MKQNIAYKENATVFGKVQCTHCGINTNLLHVELAVLTLSKPWESWDTVICKDCYAKLPSIQDESEEKAV
jgi:hypothetical protein